MTGAATVVYSILSNASAVTDLVSTRIYPRKAPQDTVAPYVVFTLVDVLPTDTKQRTSPLDKVRVQIDIYSKTSYDNVEAIHDAIRTALDNNTGTHNGIAVDGLKYETENDALDEDQDYFRRSADYFIRIKY